MDVTRLIPAPDTIPVAWDWFQAFLLSTFFLHILLMNLMLGLACIALVGQLGNNTADRAALGSDIAGALPFTIAFAVNLGVAPLLFVQVLYGHLIYTSSILMAAFWLAVIALLIGVYALAYVYKYRFDGLGGRRPLVVGLITLMLLAIGFIYVNNFTLMQQPQTWDRYFDRPGGLLLNLGDPTLWARYLHFMLSAPAIGGLANALYHHWREKKGATDAGPMIRYGCRWFTHATLLNFAVGLWFAAVLPRGLLNPSNAIGLQLTVVLSAGILCSIAAVVFGFRARPVSALLWTLATLALMILARSLLRTAMLAPWFSPSQLAVHGEYGPLALFLLFLAGGIGLVIWMLRMTSRSVASGEVRP